MTVLAGKELRSMRDLIGTLRRCGIAPVIDDQEGHDFDYKPGIRTFRSAAQSPKEAYLTYSRSAAELEDARVHFESLAYMYQTSTKKLLSEFVDDVRCRTATRFLDESAPWAGCYRIEDRFEKRFAIRFDFKRLPEGLAKLFPRSGYKIRQEVFDYIYDDSWNFVQAKLPYMIEQIDANRLRYSGSAKVIADTYNLFFRSLKALKRDYLVLEISQDSRYISVGLGFFLIVVVARSGREGWWEVMNFSGLDHP